MTSHKDTVNDKIHDIADNAKSGIARIVDRASAAAEGVVEKASEHVRRAGNKIKDAGDRIVKGAE